MGATLALSGPAAAQAPEPHFKGKQFTIFVGSSAGGGYDTYSRLIARHWGRLLPGSPAFIVSNMPGAGGNLVANHIYRIAPKDGTAIGMPQSGVILEPLIGSGATINHDPAKFHYVGSANNDVYICVARLDAPAKSFAEALDKEIVLAASNASSTSEYARMLKNVLGAKFRIVSGYTGSREIGLAIEKGEAQAACGLAWPSISVTQPGWFGDKPLMHVILQTHAEGHPDLNKKAVPLAASFAKTSEQKAILELFFSQTIFGRPYLVAPEVPTDRVAVLRQTFAALFKDAEFVAEARKLNLDIDMVPGEVVQSLVEKIYRSPPELIAKTKAALTSE